MVSRLGLDVIHTLTSSGTFLLRVDLEDWEGNTKYAEYSTFSIDGEADDYMAHLGTYLGGTLDNSLSFINNDRFSTLDRDNDASITGSCSWTYGGGGGWWYANCNWANLNGGYFTPPNHTAQNNKQVGIVWWRTSLTTYSYKRTMMRVRPST